MGTERKRRVDASVAQLFPLGGRVYELVEVDGPLRRGSDTFPTQFDHDAGVLRVSRTVPVEQRAWVVAVAVSDACFRLWRPVPVEWPDWLPADRPASSAGPPVAAGRGRRRGRPAPTPGLAGGPQGP